MVLIETVLLVGLVVATLFFSHLEVIRLADRRLQQLQTERLEYDGEGPWKKD